MTRHHPMPGQGELLALPRPARGPDVDTLDILRRAITRLATTRATFSADDLSDDIRAIAEATPPQIGAAFRQAHADGLIVATGQGTEAHRRPAKGRTVRIWKATTNGANRDGR